MNLAPIKYLLFIENVTAVFRNYLCLTRCTRVIVLFWILIEAFILSLTAMANFAPEKNLAQRIYFFSSTAFSIYLLIASLCYSKKFDRLLLNFDAFYKCFHDGVYCQKMLKAQTVLTCKVVSFCSFVIFLFTYFRVSESIDSIGWMFAISIYFNGMSDFRYLFQYFILYCILFVVTEQLKAITRSIDSELVMMEKRRNMEHADLSSVAVNHDKLSKWVKAYENITNSSHLCNSIFSVQLTIMLLMVTMYYILVLYSVAITAVKGGVTLTSLFPNMFSMMVFLIVLFIISRAGQQIQNSYSELRQKLCELCVLNTLENEEYYKLAKDLLRCVHTRPVRVHVFGTLDVNMSMLPSIVAFFTSYTVIALQFNNVL